MKHSNMIAARYGALKGELQCLEISARVYTEYEQNELMANKYKAALSECLAIINGDYDEKYERMIEEMNKEFG
jgi:hypothetical protein